MVVDQPIFSVLGPLDVRIAGHPARVGGTKPRQLLASLLLDAGRTVGAEHLVEVLWPRRPPRSAHANIRTYVSSLRGGLGAAGVAILARPHGYAIEVPVERLDLLLFEDLLAGARAAEDAGDAHGALGSLRAALALWRGVPLADLPGSPLWDGRLQALAEARLAAAERLVDLGMALGRYAAAVGELRGLLAEHPFREDLWQRLILALHRSGRQAEALGAYAEIRRRLVAELGVEPGTELQRAHAAVLSGRPAHLAVLAGEPATAATFHGDPVHPAVLTGEPATAAILHGDPVHPAVSTGEPATAAILHKDLAHPAVPAGGPAHPLVPAGDPVTATTAVPPSPAGGCPPRQLPADLPDFTGRAGEVAALTRAISPGEGQPGGPPAIAVVSGPPGVGKSVLAVRCAHAVRDAYPGGQLYLRLGGTDREPVDPGELLAQALRALGVGDAALPRGTDERSALYRSLLAEQPMLVLLDDAAGAAQVRPLLPGSGCTVLVTSRRRIAELPGALRLQLEVLPPEEAEELLGRIVGAERVAGEREAASAIVRHCGFLPLAVRIAGARLVGRPGQSLDVLRRRLADEPGRLDELRAGDLEVRGSIEQSYRLLPDDAARTFRALGLLGPGPLPGWVAGAVLDRRRADDVMDVLVDANLVQLAGTGPLGEPRYRLHDLFRRTAGEKAAGLAERPALTRVLGAWTATAETAAARLPTTIFGMTAKSAVRWNLPDDTAERLTADPLSWFDAEHDVLVGAVGLAADAGLAGSAWGLAAALVPYFDLRCHFDAWQRTHRTALEAARLADDRQGEAAMLRGLAQVCLYQDRYSEAAGMFRRSRMIFRELGDVRGEAISICGLGAVNQFCGEYVAALGYFRRALGMFLAMDDPGGEAYARQAMGRVCLESGDLERAARWLGDALRLATRLGDPHREGAVSLQFGRLHVLSAELDRAMRFQGQALDIFESLGDRHCGAYAMQGLGGLQAVRGERAHASARLERSLVIFQQLGDRSGEATAAQTLGELHRSAGRAGLARDYLHRARRLRREVMGCVDLAAPVAADG
ncbi:AfsR/SARP family transcriptional regulator [Streptosporangium sp. NBC_01469]|uniref:AfsR/SARP family transcriptional regulator n=1 Tax=Streptosporangium sp. NBC_01469 TaxID=2903898 RepID=UPI002E297AD2|nr:BTAD domain-containing putative transcriptional regulator [Streptosporangium sp. NBC_01469]